MRYVAHYSAVVVHMSSTTSSDFGEVTLRGLTDDIGEAEKLINKIVQEVVLSITFY